MTESNNIRTYDPLVSAVFLKTKDRFGGLSNMAPGFPLVVNGIHIRTSEALYQACRYPHKPEVQRRIIHQRSPMTAKMHSRKYQKVSRADWDVVRVQIMRWCLRIKLAQNWHEFGRLLMATEHRPIVEQSRRDAFWGAKVAEDGTLVGINALGRLLMELREQLKTETSASLSVVKPLSIPEFLLLREPIAAVRGGKVSRNHSESETRRSPRVFGPIVPESLAPSLFDQGESDVAPGRYPIYRDSGQRWLGRIPAHWERRRVKYLLRECDTRSIDGSEDLLRVSQYTGVTIRSPTGDPDDPDSRASSLVGYKCVEPNDLVVNIMLAWNGSLGVSQFRGIASPAYCVYRFNSNAHPWYFHHLLRSPVFKARIKSVSTGVVESRLRLYTDDLYRLEAIVPTLSEQNAIVRFLNHADRRIEHYIRAKQKLIALLEEQKQAIIHQAVTGQIDVRSGQPYPVYKASGMDWLGTIPGHWRFARLKAALSQPTQNGLFKKKDQFGSGVPLINVGDVYNERLGVDSSSLDLVDASPQEVRRFHVQDGDILFVRSSLKLEGTGRSAIAMNCHPETVFECHLVQARPDGRQVNFRYLVTQLNSYVLRHFLVSRANMVTMATIAQDTISSCPILLPPRIEQDRIIRWIDIQWNRISNAIADASRHINLMQEYRTRLIADVVTGKLDVRQAATELPEVDPFLEHDLYATVHDDRKSTTDEFDGAERVAL